MKKIIALDIETTCNVPNCKGNCDHAVMLYKNRITVVGILIDGIHKLVIRDLDKLHTFFKNIENEDYVLLGHNLKFDLKVLSTFGFTYLLDKEYEDTMLMAVATADKLEEEWLVEYDKERMLRNKQHKALTKSRKDLHRKAGQYSLKTLAPYFVDDVAPFWEVYNKDDDTYVLQDVINTYKLYLVLKDKITKEGAIDFYRDFLLPADKMLLMTELRGMRIDLDLLKQFKHNSQIRVNELHEELLNDWKDGINVWRKNKVNELREKFKKIKDDQLEKKSEFNIDSPLQIKWLLNDHYKLKLTNKDDKESVDAKVLSQNINKHFTLSKYLEYKKEQKLITAFFNKYEKDNENGILYCNFNLNGTRTGRLSSSNPNLQQVARNIKQMFIAREGYKLLIYDMESVEPVMIAAITEDPALCNIVLGNHNFHSVVTQLICDHVTCEENEVKKLFPKERDLAKQVDLSLFYGSGARMVKEISDKHNFNWSVGKCQDTVNEYREMFKGVFSFKKALDSRYAGGKTIANVFGRQRKFINDDDIYMKAFNGYIQSSASDLVVDSAVNTLKDFKKQGINGSLLALVHDEGVYEVEESKVHEAEEIIKKNMTRYYFDTKFGRIKFKVAGEIATYWKK